MATATVSARYKRSVPEEARNAMRLKPGDVLEAIPHEDRIELARMRPSKQLRGFLRGIDTNIPREEDRI